MANCPAECLSRNMALWGTTPICVKGWETPAPTKVKNEAITITTGNGRKLRDDIFPVCQAANTQEQSVCSKYEPRRQQNQP